MKELINLQYSIESLETIISSRTIEFHHGKHLKNYVDTYNRLVADSEYKEYSIEETFLKSHMFLQSINSADTEQIKNNQAIFNNAGQILNHNLYFSQFVPKKSYKDLSKNSVLYKKIVAQWADLESFKNEFVAAGASIFGSGWVFLSLQRDGTLLITKELGASNPILKDNQITPLFTFDVWEHAYYLDYQNRRIDYLNSLWQILDWESIEQKVIG